MRSLILSILLVTTAITPLVAAAEEILVNVNGLVCGFCAQGIKKTFSKIDSVSDVQVDLGAKKVTIALKEGQKLADDEVRKLITDAGYTVVDIERK